MTTSLLERRIRQRYKRFFAEFGINPKTGSLKTNPALKFATYPYIGSKYIAAGTKILFVGLDLGKDESAGILEFAPKRRIVAGMHDDLKKMNVHISGMYVSALFLSGYGKLFEGAKSYKAAVTIFKNTFHENPLSQIAFTNLFKFVTKNRVNGHGGSDRQHILKAEEELLLLDEILIFGPDIILFQSMRFTDAAYDSFFAELKRRNPGTNIYIAPHPSYHGSREAIEYRKAWRLKF